MDEDDKSSRMVEAILDYIYEEGVGRINNAEAIGIVEFVKIRLIEDLMEKE